MSIISINFEIELIPQRTRYRVIVPVIRTQTKIPQSMYVMVGDLIESFVDTIAIQKGCPCYAVVNLNWEINQDPISRFNLKFGFPKGKRGFRINIPSKTGEPNYKFLRAEDLVIVRGRPIISDDISAEYPLYEGIE